jgi:hypothetical protein
MENIYIKIRELNEKGKELAEGKTVVEVKSMLSNPTGTGIIDAFAGIQF